MKHKKLYIVYTLLIITMLFAACQKPTATPVAETEVSEVEVTKEVTEVQETEAPVVEETETSTPTDRKGGWMDQIIFSTVDEAPNAVAQIQAGALDIYSYFIQEPDTFETVKSDANLAYSNSYGTMDYILYNVHGPEFNDGRFNPFSNQKIREATNWLIDREYLVQESIGGMGSAKTVVLISAFPDYARYIDLIRPLEARYAYNFEKAKAVITAEMEGMGAVLVDGKWMYNDEPVVIIGLIRTEDERLIWGNYFADQLESIGFTVDRQTRTRSELSPIWVGSDPTEGEWHFYTGGSFYTGLVRNMGNFFVDFYSNLTAGTNAEGIFAPPQESLDVYIALQNNNFTTMEERRELFAQALENSLAESPRVFVLSLNSFFPRVKGLDVVTDLGGGVCGSSLFGLTAKWEGQEGGVLRTASSGIFVDPWNPIFGSNWTQDSMPYRATQDEAVASDPYTGLSWPQRIEKAEVLAVNGTPMTKTLDWVSLDFTDEITVPEDAWVDWDAVNQKWITAGEKWPEGMTARTKNTVYYPENLWDITWHDGSNLSVGDFVNYMISYFDQGKLESPIHDETQIAAVDSLLTHLKGIRIISTDPLVIETYDDLTDIDAENQVAYRTINWFPTTQFGPLAWHSFTPAFLAESNNELAFSTEKSTALSIEWTNYIAGPSLDILGKYLDQAQAESYIPYAATLSQFITAEEAATRYANLKAFFGEYGHYWIGTGPYVLAQVNSTEKSAVMDHFDAYIDDAGRWDGFGEPKIAIVDVMGPVKVTQGEAAIFDIFVSYEDEPYASEEIEVVNYLMFDGDGNLLSNGVAEFVAEGQYLVTLSAEETATLAEGATKIEFVVVSKVVSLPVFSAAEFMVAAP